MSVVPSDLSGFRGDDVVTRLFNHDFQFTYPDSGQVPGIAYFGGCILPSTTPADVIQLHPDVKPELAAILDHYNAAGIECTDRVVWDLSPSAALAFPEAEYSLHMFTEKHHRVRPNSRRLAATQRFNSKNEFIRWCWDKSFDVPPTRIFDVGEPASLEGLTPPVLAKTDVSSTGRAVFRCATADDVADRTSSFTTPYQLQQELAASAFLNVQYSVRDGHAEHLLTNQQLIERFRYAGSEYPAAEEPRSLTDPMAAALAEEGLEDVFGIDVAVVPEPDGSKRFVALEVNPRYNGSTYFHEAAQRLSVAEWSGATVSTSSTTVADMMRRLGDLAYDPSRKSGVLAINWGRILAGMPGLMFIGTRDEQVLIRREVSAVLK